MEESAHLAVAKIYAAYESWCDSAGEKPLAKRSFASRSVTAYEAEHAGPWSVVKRGDGLAIVREGQSDPAALFRRFETAHLIAAILPGVARVRLYYTRSSKVHP